MKNKLSCLLAIFLMTACLRFTPSYDKSDLDSFEDKESFFYFEELQKAQLEQLVKSRKSIEEETNDYLVGVEDLIEVNVFDVEELNRTVRVRPSGFISLPLIGAVKAEGLTEGDLQSAIVKRLDQFMYNPQVQIFIAEYSANKISVIGSVAKPGSYPIKRGNYSLLELLSEAGGRTEDASSRIVIIPTSISSAEEVLARAKLGEQEGESLVADITSPANGIEIYFEDLIGSYDKPSIKVPLRPGDTVIIPEAGAVQIDGEVEKPGSYPLGSKMSLLGAIASAGGLTYSADVREVEVIRGLPNGKKSLVTFDLEELALERGEDVRLRDGDVVRVTSASGRFATRQVVEGINSLFTFSSRVTP